MTIAGSGDPARADRRVAVHVYAANASMQARYFYNADGELLIVPQQGRARFATELGVLEVAPGEICVIPRGIKFRVDLPDGASRGYICESYGGPLRLPELGAIGANGLANARDFLAPVAAFEDLDADCRIVAKFLGKLWIAEIDHSPLDVVAWHGNYAPYKYDLARFNCINTVSFDHPDPSIYTVLTSPSGVGFRHLPAALAGGRAYVPPAVVPPQSDERIHGPDLRQVRREGRRLSARRRQPAQLHVGPRTRRGNLRARQHRRTQAAASGRYAGLHVRDSAGAAPHALRAGEPDPAARILRVLAGAEEALPAMTEALRTLLSGLIDYAGLFPPASLEMAEAARNYEAYRSGPHSWALGRFIVPSARLNEVDPDWSYVVLGVPPRAVPVCELKVETRCRGSADTSRCFPKA